MSRDRAQASTRLAAQIAGCAATALASVNAGARACYTSRAGPSTPRDSSSRMPMPPCRSRLSLGSPSAAEFSSSRPGRRVKYRGCHRRGGGGGERRRAASRTFRSQRVSRAPPASEPPSRRARPRHAWRGSPRSQCCLRQPHASGRRLARAQEHRDQWLRWQDGRSCALGRRRRRCARTSTSRPAMRLIVWASGRRRLRRRACRASRAVARVRAETGLLAPSYVPQLYALL